MSSRLSSSVSVTKPAAFGSINSFNVNPKYPPFLNVYFKCPELNLIINAGKRLYTYYSIDHELLFEYVSELQGKFLLTYDNTADIRKLAEKYKLEYTTIPMKTTLHYKKEELLISDNFKWL